MLAAFDGRLAAFGAVAETIFSNRKTVVFRDCAHADGFVCNDLHRLVGKTARAVGNDHWDFLLAGGEFYRLTVACPCIIGGIRTNDVGSVGCQIR